MILSDKDILKEIKANHILIKPFVRKNLQPSTLDLTLAPKMLVFDNYTTSLVDPIKDIDITRMIDFKKSGYFILHPGEFVLGSTVEKVGLPNNLAATLEGRSSLGRLGLIVHATAGYIDPGFEGNITFEISNISRLPIKLYAGMRVGQLAFYKMSSPVSVPYGSKKLKSKYQNQTDPTASRIFKDFKK